MKNDTQVNNNSARDVLFEAECQSTELLVELQRLKALLYFLSDFFEYETLDPDSPNEPIRTHSYCMLAHYREYQSIFEIAFNTVCTLNSSAGTLSDTISTVLDSRRHNTGVDGFQGR